MKTTLIGDLFYWSEWQADRRIDFNGFFLQSPWGNLLIDPLAASDEPAAFAEEKGGVAAIVLTNADHWRGTTAWRERFGAEVWAPEGDRARFGHDRVVDHWFADTAQLPEVLRKAAARVLWLRGGKSPVEAALWFEPIGVLLFGDLVRSHVSGDLRLLPADKLADRAAVRESLRPVLALPADTILLGDGDCLFRGGREALRELAESLAE